MATEIRELHALVREVRIAARPEIVFAYFVDPDRMARWLGAASTMDAHPGGALAIEVLPGANARGAFLEVSPPTRVVFTWGWDGDHPVQPGSSIVEVTLTPDGDGTLLRLTHRDLPTAHERERHTEGWDHFLARLATAAADAQRRAA